MLNPEDALGLQEDLAIMRNNRNRLQSAALMADEVSHHAGVSESLQRSTARMQAYRLENANLKTDLEDASSSRNDVVAISKATRDVLNTLILWVAKNMDRPVEEVRTEIFTAVSRGYDEYVEAYIAQGAIKKDQRKNPEVMKHRDWYIEP